MAIEMNPRVVHGLEGLVDASARPARLATGAGWSEGPMWAPARGSVLWSDIHGNRILEHSLAEGTTSVYREDVEFTNGRVLHPDGSIIQCSHGRRRIERDRDGTISEIVASFGGRRFNSPNDVVVAGDGSIWFTDPPYGIRIAAEGHLGESEYDDCFVFRYDPDSDEVRPVIVDIEEPNGLAFSPDESVLYVSDTSIASRKNGNHHIRAYDVVSGRCKNGRVFAVVEQGFSDGFRIDADGNLWTSSAAGVLVYSPDGALLGGIDVPETVANLCFGGPEGTTLFIAATTSLYAIETLTVDATRAGRTSR